MSAYALIADADPRRLELYRGIVEQQGLEPVTTRDGEQARLVLRQRGAPALLVTDLSLPRADGFALLAELRRLAPEERAPAVVVSAFLELRNAAHQRRDALGITELLAKGAPAESVQRAIARAVARPRATRARSPAPPTTPPAVPPTRSPERLAALEASGHLRDDVPQDPALEALLREVAERMGMPIALITLVARDRQFFKGHVGLDERLARERGTPVDWSFCRHVVDAGGNASLVVPDAAAHPVFARNPLVRDLGIRSYAGAPLVTPAGQVLGTLCVLGRTPASLDAAQVDQLEALARRVAGELELRAQRPAGTALDRSLAGLMTALGAQASASGRITLADVAGTVSYLREVLDALDVGIVLYDAGRRVSSVSRAAAELFGARPEALQGLAREEFVEHLATLAAAPEALRRQMQVLPEGPFAAHAELELAQPRRRVLRWSARPVRLPDGGPGQLALFTDITAEREAREEMARLAGTDPVTGLLAGGGAEDALAREFSRARRYGSPLTVALLTVAAARREAASAPARGAPDDVLRAVARVLRSTARSTDVLLRWGGEEFVALLPGVGQDGGQEFVRRAQAAVAGAAAPDAAGLAGLIAGVAELRPGEDLQAVLLRADARLTEARSGGPGTLR